MLLSLLPATIVTAAVGSAAIKLYWHPTCCSEAFPSNVNGYCGLKAYGILGATCQEVTHNKLIQRLLVCNSSSNQRGLPLITGMPQALTYSEHCTMPLFLLWQGFMQEDSHCGLSPTWVPVMFSWAVPSWMYRWMSLVIMTTSPGGLPHGTTQDGLGMLTPAGISSVLIHNSLQGIGAHGSSVSWKLPGSGLLTDARGTATCQLEQ